MNRFVALLLSVWVALAGVLSAHAQSITTIYPFYGDYDGAGPRGNLTLGPDGNFYGTTSGGGDGNRGNGNGTVFKVTTNGLLTVLINFNDNQPGLPFVYGASPWANLTLGPDGNFYGTTSQGGYYNHGTVFKLMTNGNATTLVMFNDTNGAMPAAGLTLGPDGNLYGVTMAGGDTNLNGGQGYGSVFKVTTNGTLTTLVNFEGTNGGHVTDALTLGQDGNFYDTTQAPYNLTQPPSPTGAYGTVFQVTTNGTLTTLVNFNLTNGANPDAGLTLGPDGNLYGTTGSTYGSNVNNYTVFKVITNGALTTLANFTNTSGQVPFIPNTLTLGPDGNFYGTTYGGGTYGEGTVFEVTTNGTLTTLVSFNGTNGANPMAGLTLGPDGYFYGVTSGGGSVGNPPISTGYGTIFRLNLQSNFPPPLPPAFIMAPTNVTAIIGSSATFNCQVSGTPPFAYQWLSNSIPIAGATNASLTISPALATKPYQLVVSNIYGSTNKIVLLSVLKQPNVYSVSNRGAGNFTVYLANTPNTTNRLWMSTNVSLHQWQVIATNITDSNGLAQFFDTNTAKMPQKFYRLSYP